MNLLPKTSGYAWKSFMIDNWLYILIILAVLVILALAALLVYYFVKKRCKQNSENLPEKSDTEQKVKQKGMPASSLARIWKEFLKEIPWTVRPNIMAYEHFIVFGEAGSGKSALIDNYTDWEGHARQFYPSYTVNPLLQIYLGSKVLVQEIPASLLDDTSEQARRALLKLWKPLFKRHNPTVVIVLNGLELQAEEPDYLEYLKQKAQIIRGKINLLGHIRKKPIRVRIALTHMDQIDGFIEFSQFLTQSNIPLKLELSSKSKGGDIPQKVDSTEETPVSSPTTDINNMSGWLYPYEEHLTRALISLPADKYLKAITFLSQAPKLFQDLSVFIKLLQDPDPLSLEPEVTNVYLTSQTEETTSVLNPFTPSLTVQELKKIDPYFRHRVAAAAIGVAGLVFFSATYFHGRSLIVERYHELERVEASPPARYDQKMHELLPLVYKQQHPVLKLLPDFFQTSNREITRRCMDNIRKHYLLPELDRIAMEMTAKPRVTFGQLVTISSFEQQYSGKIENTQDKAIYLLALIYATRENGLGKLIQHNPASWSQILNLSKTMIEDYVHNNESSSGVSLSGKKLSFRPPQGTAEDPRRWMVYFTEVGRLYQQPVLTPPELEKLQRDTDQFLGVIQQMEFYDLSVKLAKLLRKEVPSDINLDIIANKESELRQAPIKNFLNFIKNSNMAHPDVTGLGLAGLLENLKVMLNSKPQQGESDLPFRFSLGGEQFNFSTQQWNDLLNRSRISLFLRAFVNTHKNQEGLLFFPSGQEFEDIVMNPSNDGRFLFIGHARVDGRFTREAIEKRVKPVLNELPGLINSLPLLPKDKTYFSNFLFKEVDIYGRRYAQYYRKYYMEFDMKAGSPAALRFVLSQIVLPTSPLREVLVTIMDNTLIDPGNNEYLQFFVRNLNEFAFIKRLVGEQKGTFPELDRYKALMEQMLADMQDQQQEPSEKKDKEETYTQLRNRLTPLGRIGFAIFNKEKDSYVNLVKLWLDSVAVPRQWQDIFLAPVWQAYFLGMAEVESEIGKTWTDLWRTDIQPLYSKFPFLGSSGEDVSVDDLQNATHPSGHFWQTYKAMLSPFCTEDGRRWRRKSSPFNIPKLPNNMLSMLNNMTQLSSVLWDKEGKERPLEFMVKPEPLPSMLPNEPPAVLSYLNVGDSIVFGFNQKPSWKKIRFNWQCPSSAAVGAEFTTSAQSTRIKRTIEVPTSNWSFYRLLQKTKKYGASGSSKTNNIHALKWTIKSPATNVEGKAVDIVFDIKADPWAVFKLPR